ncbi:MAG TPA: 4-hydroxy-tetrahydrodipicolinate synthase [Alphaproteobacteria bacterium]|nr:4-hydroxy-tetrahydrodipicolinate synthase [Alphaproteobacteria bacterium]
MFAGSITALVTPFANGRIDEAAFQRFVEWQVAQGSHGLVPCGSTGESATLSHAEHERVIRLCVEAAARRVPVIAGTGSNSTDEAVSLTRSAKESGADAALVVTPYYNKPTQEGLYLHYKKIHDSVEIPIIIYNIPGRTGIDMTVDTMARLAELPRIVGVKDATTDLTRPARTRAKIGPDFCQLSGEDPTAAAFLAEGGHGVISVTANVAPRVSAELQNAWKRGDFKTVGELRDLLTPLNAALFVEVNPIPVKYAVSLLGFSTPALRLPLTEATEATKRRVEQAMRDVKVLN